MKKTLVALAALASVSAFAQSSVTLSGNLDVAYGSAKAGTASSEKTVSTKNLTSSTSVIKIVAVEDLGGGLKSTVQYGIDPRGTTDAGATSPTRDESFIGLAGSMGNVRLGAPNSIGLTTFLAGSPFGTGIGGGYGKNALDYSNIRYDRSARYDSPVFAGFTVSVLRAQGATAAVNTTLQATNAAILSAADTVNEYGVSYANGPLNLAYARIAQPANGANVATSANILSANYALAPTTTLYASYNKGDLKARAATATQTKGSSVSIKQSFGKIDVLAGYSQQKQDADTTNGTVKVTGLRADYNFSKTSATYLGYDRAAANGTANDQTIVSIGLRKSF